MTAIFSALSSTHDASDLVDLLRRQTAHHLIQQDHARFGSERADKLEPLARAERQFRGRCMHPSRECGALQPGTGLDRVAAAPATTAELEGNLDVLKYAQGGEGLWNLESAGNAHATADVRLKPGDIAPIEADAAGRRRQRARDDVEERRLAGAVWTDEAERLVAICFEGYAVEHNKAAEMLLHAIDC